MIVAAFLVVAMIATTFFTQRQLMAKNMPADALTGPYAQQQKMLLYVLPFIFGISGVAFPLGVVVYWTTSNLWTMGQQFYVIRNNPAPGQPAAKAKEVRDKAKARKKRRGVAAYEVPARPDAPRRTAARAAAAAEAPDPVAAQAAIRAAEPPEQRTAARADRDRRDEKETTSRTKSWSTTDETVDDTGRAGHVGRRRGRLGRRGRG